MKFKFPGVKILDRYIMRKFLGTYIFAIALIIVLLRLAAVLPAG